MKVEFDKIESAEKYAVGSTRGGKNTYSLNLICTQSNGKRLTFSKGLISILGLAERVYIGAIFSDRKLIVSQNQLSNLTEYKLGTGRILYNSRLVDGLVSGFGLKSYYESHSSKSFTDIEFDEEQGIAVIAIPTAEDM